MAMTISSMATNGLHRRLTARLCGARSAVQVYGSEIWADRRWDATWGLTGSDAVISDCHFTARYMDEHQLRPAGSTRVLWDCVDTGRYTPGAPSDEVLQRYGIPDPRSHVNLLTLGRMSKQSPNKGYDQLLAVFAKLRELESLRLVYGGSGDQVEDLRAEAKRLGLADRVHFLGFIHEDDLPDVYRSAEIFSLVSHRSHGHGEGIPLTPLEAAACGKPIWVTEFNGADWSGTGSWSMVDSYTTMIELLYYFENTPYVERYAVFPWDATWPAGAPTAAASSCGDGSRPSSASGPSAASWSRASGSPATTRRSRRPR